MCRRGGCRGLAPRWGLEPRRLVLSSEQTAASLSPAPQAPEPHATRGPLVGEHLQRVRLRLSSPLTAQKVPNSNGSSKMKSFRPSGLCVLD